MPSKKINCVNPTKRSRSSASSEKQFNKRIVTLKDSASQLNAPRLTTIHKLVLGQNLSDIPCDDNLHLTAFLISYAQYDLARMSDDQLEILAGGLPCGGCDE
jgi:hypothetical protein